MPLIEVEHLKKTYHSQGRKVEALKDVSFFINEGETLGILGPSGSGKSTIGQILTGLLQKDSGDIVYMGDILKFPIRGKKRQEIQMLFQHPEMSLNPKYPLKQSFKEIYKHYHIPYKYEDMLNYIAGYGLYKEHMERRPGQLSGGELQRTVIARIMLLEPKLIVLDEPTSMLDVISQAQILRMLKDVQKKMNVSYLYITHDEILAKFMCDRILYLSEGILTDVRPNI